MKCVRCKGQGFVPNPNDWIWKSCPACNGNSHVKVIRQIAARERPTKPRSADAVADAMMRGGPKPL